MKTIMQGTKFVNSTLIGFWGRIIAILEFWHLKSITKLQWYTIYFGGGGGGGGGAVCRHQYGIICDGWGP